MKKLTFERDSTEACLIETIYDETSFPSSRVLSIHTLIIASIYDVNKINSNMDEYDRQRVYNHLQDIGSAQSNMRDAMDAHTNLSDKDYSTRGLDLVRAFSGTAALGEHTRKCLRSMGYDEEVVVETTNSTLLHASNVRDLTLRLLKATGFHLTFVKPTKPGQSTEKSDEWEEF